MTKTQSKFNLISFSIALLEETITSARHIVISKLLKVFRNNEHVARNYEQKVRDLIANILLI